MSEIQYTGMGLPKTLDAMHEPQVRVNHEEGAFNKYDVEDEVNTTFFRSKLT